MNPNLRRRLKYVAPLVVKKVSFENLDRKYVGLEHIESWTGRILYDDLTTLPEGTVSLFEPNDVLFGKLRPYLAKVSLVDFSGACSTEALVLRPKTNQWPPFVRYVLSNGEFIDDVNSSTFGAKMPRASWEFIGSRTVPVPDLPTQKAIADFLDRETARIDQLIEWKQRMVEVLGESLAVLLERLTTPDSQNDTNLIPFRWVCRVTEGQVDPTDPHWAPAPLIAPNHIQSNTGRILAFETAEDQGAISGKYAYSAGTVLYSKIRPALAKACIAPQAGLCSADMYPILTDYRLFPEFLLMQLLSRRFTDWATLESMRVAMPKINRETLGDHRFWVPCQKIQARLIGQFTTRRMKIEQTTDAVTASIDRLREFRSALITASVTGEIDVSTWGKQGTADRRLDQIEEAASA